VGIGDLPAEVLLHALSFVSPADLGRAEVVSAEWHQLVRDDEPTWRAVYSSFFGGPANGRFTHPSQYIL
jgi:hypothetical protein